MLQCRRSLVVFADNSSAGRNARHSLAASSCTLDRVGYQRARGIRENTDKNARTTRGAHPSERVRKWMGFWGTEYSSGMQTNLSKCFLTNRLEPRATCQFVAGFLGTVTPAGRRDVIVVWREPAIIGIPVVVCEIATSFKVRTRKWRRVTGKTKTFFERYNFLHANGMPQSGWGSSETSTT